MILALIIIAVLSVPFGEGAVQIGLYEYIIKPFFGGHPTQMTLWFLSTGIAIAIGSFLALAWYRGWFGRRVYAGLGVVYAVLFVYCFFTLERNAAHDANAPVPELNDGPPVLVEPTPDQAEHRGPAHLAVRGWHTNDGGYFENGKVTYPSETATASRQRADDETVVGMGQGPAVSDLRTAGVVAAPEGAGGSTWLLLSFGTVLLAVVVFAGFWLHDRHLLPKAAKRRVEFSEESLGLEEPRGEQTALDSPVALYPEPISAAEGDSPMEDIRRSGTGERREQRAAH